MKAVLKGKLYDFIFLNSGKEKEENTYLGN